jgi:hypothetical protein
MEDSAATPEVILLDHPHTEAPEAPRALEGEPFEEAITTELLLLDLMGFDVSDVEGA